MEPEPEYTELGIKIHKFRFTLRVQRRTPTPSMSEDNDGASGASGSRPGSRQIRSRTNSTASSIADSLGLLGIFSFFKFPPQNFNHFLLQGPKYFDFAIFWRPNSTYENLDTKLQNVSKIMN